MSKYHLSNAAVEDLRGILEYTLEEWGAGQVLAYRNRIEDKLTLLAKFPGMGRSNVYLPSDTSLQIELDDIHVL